MQFGRKKKHFAVYDAGHLQGLRASSWGRPKGMAICISCCLAISIVKRSFCPFLCTPMSRSHHKVEDHGRMILSCQPTGYKHETNINWPVSKHVDIIVDYRFHPPCHRPVKAETSPKAKPWLIGAATPPKAFVLHCRCGLRVPLGELMSVYCLLASWPKRLRKILVNVLGFAVWLTCLKCMSHTQQAVITLHDVHVFYFHESSKWSSVCH